VRVVALVLAVLGCLLLGWIAVEERYQSCLQAGTAERTRIILEGSGTGFFEHRPPQGFRGRAESPVANDCSRFGL
jgi:hypothetical protein